jgi:hypothetical protein
MCTSVARGIESGNSTILTRPADRSAHCPRLSRGSPSAFQVTSAPPVAATRWTHLRSEVSVLVQNRTFLPKGSNRGAQVVAWSNWNPVSTGISIQGSEPPPILHATAARGAVGHSFHPSDSTGGRHPEANRSSFEEETRVLQHRRIFSARNDLPAVEQVARPAMPAVAPAGVARRTARSTVLVAALLLGGAHRVTPIPAQGSGVWGWTEKAEYW